MIFNSKRLFKGNLNRIPLKVKVAFERNYDVFFTDEDGGNNQLKIRCKNCKLF